MILRYVIPLNPVSKKNHQMILRKADGTPFIAQSKQYRIYEQTAALYLTPKPARPVSDPVNVRCVFYMGSRRRCDLTNLEAAAHDILVRSGILADDNRDIIATTDGSMVLYDKGAPRTEIEITPVDGWEKWHE